MVLFLRESYVGGVLSVLWTGSRSRSAEFCWFQHALLFDLNISGTGLVFNLVSDGFFVSGSNPIDDVLIFRISSISRSKEVKAGL